MTTTQNTAGAEMDRTARIKYLGRKIFTEQSFTMDELKEYTRLVNDAVLGR